MVLTKEKDNAGIAGLPQAQSSSTPKTYPWRKLFILLTAGFLFHTSSYIYDYLYGPAAPLKKNEWEGVCVQEKPLRPSAAVASTLDEVYGLSNFTDRAAEALGGAVRVKTEVFDEWGPVGEDDHWEPFGDFHDYLKDTFPKVHAHLSLTKVNTYGLLYEWKGSNESLEPLLLMAHQDVVPVDPAVYSQWLEPPYSGTYKDGWVWGRGSCDDKAGLIGSLLSVETLLEAGFKPQRTVVLSFGFDEEASGVEGARHLATYLAEHGPKQFAMIVDEGSVYVETMGRVFAQPAIAEKGFLDVKIQVNTAGGHSSIPPKHTSIGYLALLIAHIEANPPKPRLLRTSPIFETMECIAAHGPETPELLKREVLRAIDGDQNALQRVQEIIFSMPQYGAVLEAILSTTQAVDIISGGVKSNALPEEVFAIVNQRIVVESSVSELQASVTALIRPVVEKYNLDLIGFDGSVVFNATTGQGSAGTVKLSDAWGTALEPAPISPTNSAAYRLLSGTIRGTWASQHPDAQDIIVAPSMMGGNTDTKYYWDLSRNIYRYTHVDVADSYNGAHTVNEAMRVEGFVGLIKFFTTLILNVDESRAI